MDKKPKINQTPMSQKPSDFLRPPALPSVHGLTSIGGRNNFLEEYENLF